MQPRADKSRDRASDRVPLAQRLSEPMAVAVIALGITQIIAWGSTIYALGVLAKPIAADTGWSMDLVVGGITCGLLASGLVSTTIGRLIDKHGGRRVMTLGSAMMALAQMAIALAPSAPLYLAAWTVLGVAMRMSLYDAAFVALVQVAPSRGRKAISYLTLFGGFASSIFWPIGHVLGEAYGWRATFLIFAVLNMLVCLPLHWFGLNRREAVLSASGAVEQVASAHAPADVLDGPARTIAMVLFATVLSACAFVFGALAVMLPALLQASGISAAQAVVLAAIKGLAQVGGRLADILYGQHLGPLTLGRIAVVLLPLSFLVLLAGGGGFVTALCFTVLFGISNGLLTIVRGAVPLALFGTTGYGRVMGVLSTPYLLMNATAPVLLTALVERTSFSVGTFVMLGAAAAAGVAMEVMAAWYRGYRQQF